MASQEVFLLIDADRISPKVERAVRTNNPQKIADMAQNIERGDKIIRSWLEDNGGRVLLFHGDEIYASVPGEKLTDLGRIHTQMQEAWKDGITIGVGLDLNEAKKALEAGKKRGGNRIVFYAPEIEQMTNEESASDSHDAKEATPDSDELKTLSKANTPSPEMGIHAAKHASLMADTGEQPSPQSGLTPYGPPQTSASGETPLPPSATNMAEGLASAGPPGASPVEQQFHNAAAGTEAEAARAEAQAHAAQPADPGLDQLKQRIVAVLQKVKQQAPVLEALKQQAPDAYQAIVAAVQAMLMMAKALIPQGQEQAQEQTQGQEPGQEPSQEATPKETKKSEEEITLKLDELDTAFESLAKTMRELRSLRSAVLNDSLTPEQLAKIIQTIVENPVDVRKNQTVITDLIENAQFKKEHGNALFHALMTIGGGQNINARREAAWHMANQIYDRAPNSKFDSEKAFTDLLSVDPAFRDQWRGQFANLLTRLGGRLVEDDSGAKPETLKALWDWHTQEQKDGRLSDRDAIERKSWVLKHPNVPKEIVESVQDIPGYWNHLSGSPHLSKKRHAFLLRKATKTINDYQAKQKKGHYTEYEDDVAYEKAREQLADLVEHHHMSVPMAIRYQKKYWGKSDPTDPDQGEGMPLRNIDEYHKFSVPIHVKPGLHKLRKIRDLIASKGGEATPADIGKPATAFLGNIGRLPNGNYGHAAIQAHIDASPALKLWSSQTEWSGAQRHSYDPSRVLQVSMPQELVERLRPLGVSPRLGWTPSHPGHPAGTLGWVRWTGNESGAQIDEIQHDFPFWAAKRIEQVLGHPIHRVLHEAFYEHLRQNHDRSGYPKPGAPVHIWTPESKAHFSLQDQDETKIPGHFNHTYKIGPEKMGYEPSKYGAIPEVQTGEEAKQKELATQAEKLRMSEKDFDEIFQEEPLIKNDAQRARRAAHAIILNDASTPEQLDSAIKYINANQDTAEQFGLIRDLEQHPNVTAQHLLPLLKKAFYDYKHHDSWSAREFVDRYANHRKMDAGLAMAAAKEMDAADEAKRGPRGSTRAARTPKKDSHLGVLAGLMWNHPNRLTPEMYNELWPLLTPDKRNNYLGRDDVPAEIFRKVTQLPGHQLAVARNPHLPPDIHAALTKRILTSYNRNKAKEARNGGNWQLQEALGGAKNILSALAFNPAISADEADKILLHVHGPINAFDQNRQMRNVDKVHEIRKSIPLTVKPGLHKIRQIRDLIEGKGGEISPNDLGRPLANVLGNIGRLPNGNFSSKLIQNHIDNLPGMKIWATQHTWDGGQRHSSAQSQVFRVSLPTSVTEELLKQGIKTRQGWHSSHPGEPLSGLGWLRWTGDKKGVHIDEIQHDFKDEAQAKIEKVLGAPIHRVIHDAFQEWVRSKKEDPKEPAIGTPVHIWQPESKAPLSGLDQTRKLPGHFYHTYRNGPEKMGYQPAKYGALKTQTTRHLKGKPTYADVFRKSVAEIREAALSKSYRVDEPLRPKSTGIDNQVKATGKDFDPTWSMKTEQEPHEKPRPSGRLQKIRKAAMRKTDKIPGGLADKKQAKDFDQDQLKAGVKVEMEHTDDSSLAREIAMDHLTEDPNYYKKLKTMEKAALPMPEQMNKLPHKPSGAMRIQIRGKDGAPQAHQYRHIRPGEAAHVSMDGKPQGEIAVRQYQSGMTLPNENVGEGQTGILHPTSALDPKDGREKQEGE